MSMSSSNMVAAMLLKEAATAVAAMVSLQLLEDCTQAWEGKNTRRKNAIEAGAGALMARRLLIATKLLSFAFLWILVMGFGSDRLCVFMLV